MTHLYPKVGGLFLSALPLLVSAPSQQNFLTELPWWVWLVVITILLLLLFILIVALDWSSAGQVDVDENE